MITLEHHSALVREISASESRAALLAALSKMPAQFGMRHFSLMMAPAHTDRMIEPLVIETTLSRGFLRAFDAGNMLIHCPLIPLLKNMALPLCWSCKDEYRDEMWIDFPDAMRRLLQENNVPTGVAMPLHSSLGQVFVMRLDGDRNLLTLPELNELGMVFLQAFRMFDQLRPHEPAPPNLLTTRELEVVRWTSQGKTSAEIAEILSLSDHTVNTYLNKAIKKLDCTNRTQLVAKSIRLRLIN